MQQRTLLRRVLRRVLETAFEKVLEGFLEGVLQWVLMGRRVLRRGSKTGLSRRHPEGRSTPFLEYEPPWLVPYQRNGAVKTTKMTKMAGVTRAKGWFTKSTGFCS